MTGGADFLVQVQFDLAVIDHHGQLGAARVEVEAAQPAVVNEPRHVLLARVAVTRHGPRRPSHELERALVVERVRDGRRRHAAMRVQLKLTRAAAALVARPDARLLAPVAFERRLRVLELEVVRVARVRYFDVLHHGVWPEGGNFFLKLILKSVYFDGNISICNGDRWSIYWWNLRFILCLLSEYIRDGGNFSLY